MRRGKLGKSCIGKLQYWFKSQFPVAVSTLSIAKCAATIYRHKFCVSMKIVGDVEEGRDSGKLFEI